MATQKIYCVTDNTTKKFKFFTSGKLARRFALGLEHYIFDSFDVTFNISEK